MGTIKQVAESWAKVNAQNVFAETVNDTAAEFNALNKEQLKRGERPDGTSLPIYSTVSQDLFGKPDAPMTLYDTGDFYQGWDTFASTEGRAVTTSLDDKAEELTARYGNVFGLNESNLLAYLNNFQKIFVDKIKQIVK